MERKDQQKNWYEVLKNASAGKSTISSQTRHQKEGPNRKNKREERASRTNTSSLPRKQRESLFQEEEGGLKKFQLALL